MDKKFLDKMQKLLLSQKKEIVQTLREGSKEYKEIAGVKEEPKDAADTASYDIDRTMLEVLGSAELKRLKAIDAALVRISQGKYGNCIKCGKPIPKERLEALPYALMCIECKAIDERKNR